MGAEAQNEGYFCKISILKQDTNFISHYVLMLQLIFGRCCCQGGRWNGHQDGCIEYDSSELKLK